MSEYTAEDILEEVLENVADKVDGLHLVATIGRDHGSGFLTGMIVGTLAEIAGNEPDMPAADREESLMNIMAYAAMVIIQERQRDLALVDGGDSAGEPDPWAAWNAGWTI